MAPKRSPPRLQLQTPTMRDSPVFRFHSSRAGNASFDHDFDHGLSYPAQPVSSHRYNTGEWSADEHERFLEGLEKHGCGQSTSVFAAWHAIAASVGTRSVTEIKAHANNYYAQLQQVNARKRKEYLAMQQIDSRWTMHEDSQLEDALARHEPTASSISYPWDKIARRVHGKTPRDARERYKKLCYDVARIESGQHVMMHLGRGGSSSSRHRHSPSNNQRSHNDADDADSSQSLDCAITLTAQETQLLLRALEQVPVPSQASSDVLAAVASAVSALACSKNRQPPRRLVPLFSIDEALRALRYAIVEELDDPLDVLEVLATELCLLSPPAAPPPASKPSHNSHANEHTGRHHHHHSNRESSSYEDSASSSIGLSFSCLSPNALHRNAAVSPYYASSTGPPFVEKEETRSAEELLTLRTSPVHASHRDEVARTVQRYRHLDGHHSGGSGGGWPYSFQPVASPVPLTHTSSTNSYDLESSNGGYHARYRSSSRASDSLDDFM